MDSLDKALDRYQEKIKDLSPDELNDMFKHKPDEYQQGAIDFQKSLSAMSPMPALDGFAFSQTMGYLIGGMFKEPLKEVKKNALKLFEMGHTTFENEFDYGYTDQYAHVFYDKENLCFVKRNQNISYIIIFEKDTEFSKGEVHIRKYWDDAETSSYYMDKIKRLNNKINKDKPDLGLLNEIAGTVQLLSDSSYKKEFQNRPNLENVINGVGMRYKDCRDTGYIGSFEDKYDDGMQIDKGYNLNTLKYVFFDMQVLIEE